MSKETKMKKMLIGSLIALSLVVSAEAKLRDMKISKDAVDIINSFDRSDFYSWEGSAILKFNSTTNDFQSLFKTSVESVSPKSIKIYDTPYDTTFLRVNSSELNPHRSGGSTPDGICAAFVLAVTDVPRKNWKVTGKKITPSSYIKPGTIIASKQVGDKAGHVAVFIKKTSTHIYVFDQNSIRPKVVAYHKIPFNNEEVKFPNFNAYNYYVLQEKYW
jgi:hypothetical protein